jgi:hypothetical protein
LRWIHLSWNILFWAGYTSHVFFLWGGYIFHACCLSWNHLCTVVWELSMTETETLFTKIYIISVCK